MAGHAGCLSAAVTALPTASPAQLNDAHEPASARQARTGRIAVWTRQRHAAIRQLHADGRTIGTVAAEPSLARSTLRRFARAASPGELLRSDGTGRRTSIPDKHEACLRER